MLELWVMRSTLSLPLLLGPLWTELLAPDRVLSMGQIELNCMLILNWIVWNRTFWHLTVCKLKIILNWIVWNRTVYMYKNGFGLNNLQWLMYHQTKPNPSLFIFCLAILLVSLCKGLVDRGVALSISPRVFHHSHWSTLGRGISVDFFFYR